MKPKNIKVSVILPVYNVALYLRECLDSIVHQTLKEIEIICVDDGSTDNSLEILKKYAKKDKRIIIIEQENQGAGVARNTGLDVAKGEYLSFLDPDDFFETKLLETSYKKAKETSADIVVFGCNAYNVKTKRFEVSVAGIRNGIRSENLPSKDVFSCVDMPQDLYKTFGNTAWNKLYKKEFVIKNNIRFQPLFRNNDVYFVLTLLSLAEKITVCDNILLYYRRGMKTNAQSTLEEHPFTLYNASLAIRNQLKTNVHYDILKSDCYIALFSSLITHLNRIKTYSCFKIVYDNIVTNLNNDFNILELDEQFYQQNAYVLQTYEDYKLMLQNSADDYLKIKEKYFIDESDTSLKISVIIPIYNSEKYLNDCLNSVVNQTLTNIEIICINDGSTDNSGDILREYASKDNRFIVLNQSNKGQSVARNVGIVNAKGKYIYFLDSDDMIVPYALETMFFECVTNKLDVVYFDGKSIFESAILEEKHSQYKKSYQSKFSTSLVLSGARMFAKMRENNSYRVQSCLYLIKTDFVQKENILFPEGIIHEDNVFMFKTILIASRVKLIQEELLIRRVRANSTITQGITFNHFYGYLICYQEMLDYANRFEYTEDVENAVVMTLNGILNGAVKEYSVLSQEEKNKINTLTKLERHSFESLILPKVESLSYQNDMSKINDSLNWNRNQLKNFSKFDKSSVSQSYVNKINGQLNWARDELEKVRTERLEFKKEVAKLRGIKSTFSYQLGRFITWLPRKIKEIIS